MLMSTMNSLQKKTARRLSVKPGIVLYLLILAAILPRPYGCSNAQPLPVPAFDGDAAYRYLETQCSFGPRNPGSAGHAKCLNFLAGELRKFASEVRLQPFDASAGLSAGTRGLANIVASFPSPASSETPVLLCAHWDTRPVADRDPDPGKRGMPIIGANDGASGVAILLEAARRMKENPPPRPVTIAFFDGEDGGREGEIETWCLGSKHFASGLLGSEYRFAVLLDMVGDKDLSIPMEGYSVQVAQDRVDDIWRRAGKLGVPAFRNRMGIHVYDDHVPLIQAGIPSVDLIDFDYPHWHTLGDTPDKCSAASLKAVGTVILDLIYNP